MTAKLLVAALLALVSCYSVKKNTVMPKEDRLRCVNIYREFPVITETGKIFRYEPYETRIIYYKDQVMFQTYTYHAEINTREELANPPYRYVYYSFTYSPGKKYGVLCDSANIATSRIVEVDSMLKEEWAENLDFDSVFNDLDAKLLKSEKLPSGDKEETYSYVSKKDIGLKGTYSLRFSKKMLRDIPYSLSKKMDSVYGMKLIDINITSEPRDFPGYDSFHLQASSTPYRLEECRQLNKEEVMALFANEKKRIE